MDDEFKLCWKNFQDNIASGFQNLYDRGDLVDVTLACDGKLLHAHKIVLAICSPYFQEIFITNPCKHPIIILKDVTFNIMCELLEFMYQGVVNVKHIELQSFMKIGQLLQIKGLATNNSSSSAGSTSSEKSSSNVQSQSKNAEDTANATAASGGGMDETSCQTVKNTNKSSNATASTNAESTQNSSADVKASTSSANMNNSSGGGGGASSSSAASNMARSTHSPAASCSSPSPCFPNTLNHENFKTSPDRHHAFASSMKRHLELSHSDALSIYSRKQLRRAVSAQEHQDHNDSGAEAATSIDQLSAEDFFLPAIPHISMVESRYDLNNVKREGGAEHHHHHGGSASSSSAAAAAAALRNSFGPAAFGFDYNLYKNNSGGGGSGPSAGGPEFPNDLHMPSDYSKNFGNHMDIPPNSSNVVMLSSTSLLHGNCVFNRNNTVATQQGMKTYWLCKSYRISMCRARCITHQGRVISATGVHNHPPHMRNGGGVSSSGGGNGSAAAAATTTAMSAVGGYSNDGSGGLPTQAITGQSGAAVGIPLASGSMSANVPTSGISASLMQQPPSNSMSGSNTIANLRPPTTAAANMFQHSGLPPQQLSSSATSSSSAMMPHPHSHALVPPPQHLSQSLPPNLLIQHQQHSNNAANLHQLHSSLNVTTAMGTQSSQSPLSLQAQNSVIQNMMHNAVNMHHHHLPPMMSSSHQHQQQQQHQQQHHHHSPHLSEHQQAAQQQQQQQQQGIGTGLEITALMSSPPMHHMLSPSAPSSSQPNQHHTHHHHSSHHSSHHHAAGGTNRSPITSMKSPMNDQSQSQSLMMSSSSEAHDVLAHNAALSPSELNSNTVGSAADAASVSSQSDAALVTATHETTSSSSHNESAHVIESITISPGNAHNFKIEDM